MAVLYFSDILRKVDIDPKKVKLIRHALTDSGFRDCYQQNMVLEYTRRQKQGFGKGYDYWCVFISGKGTLAKFFACYKVGDTVPDTSDVIPQGFPHPEWFQGELAFFDLQHIDLLKEFEGKLTIDWGHSTRMWHQKGTTEKPIVSIQEDQRKVFSGFENLILTYDELQEIVDNPTVYESWHTALSSINAVYLIVDKKSGKQYVGSAYGENGLLGRWAYYVNSLHGNNKKLKELICAYPERYHQFQFSILQMLPKTVTNDEIIQIENLYKKKLLTCSFGLNDN